MKRNKHKKHQQYSLPLLIRLQKIEMSIVDLKIQLHNIKSAQDKLVPVKKELHQCLSDIIDSVQFH